MKSETYHWGRLATYLVCALSVGSTVSAAEVNVLIIGSTKDTTSFRSISAKSVAFSPTDIRDQLQKILDGARLGKVKVVLEDRCKAGSDADLNAQLDAVRSLRKPKKKGEPLPELSPSARKSMIRYMRLRGRPCYNIASWFHWPYPPQRRDHDALAQPAR